jgi:hypothetical protein
MQELRLEIAPAGQFWHFYVPEHLPTHFQSICDPLFERFWFMLTVLTVRVSVAIGSIVHSRAVSPRPSCRFTPVTALVGGPGESGKGFGMIAHPRVRALSHLRSLARCLRWCRCVANCRSRRPECRSDQSSAGESPAWGGVPVPIPGEFGLQCRCASCSVDAIVDVVVRGRKGGKDGGGKDGGNGCGGKGWAGGVGGKSGYGKGARHAQLNGERRKRRRTRHDCGEEGLVVQGLLPQELALAGGMPRMRHAARRRPVEDKR